MLSTSVGGIFYAAKGKAGFFEISSVWITMFCVRATMTVTDHMDTSTDRTYQTAGEALFFNECLHAGRMRAECSYKPVFKGNPVFV